MFDVLALLRDHEIEVGEVAHNGWAKFPECPSCKRKNVANIYLSKDDSNPDGPKYGKHKCFRASCDFGGSIYDLYMNLMDVDFAKAKSVIDGRTYKSNKKGYKIDFSKDQKKSATDVLPKRMNPFFVDIEPGDFAFDYLVKRGYQEEFIQNRRVLKVLKDSKKEFLEYLRSSESKLISKISYLIRNKYSTRFPDYETVKSDEEFKSFKEDDLFRAYSSVEAYRICGRAIIPCYYNGLYYGYVARSCFDQVPKTINSSGTFSSELMGDWDMAKKHMTIVLCEGWGDSWACGDHSIYLYGKNFKIDSLRHKLLTIHPCKNIVIYLDPGAERDALRIYNILAASGKNVVIVKQINDIEYSDDSLKFSQKLMDSKFDGISIEEGIIQFPVYLYQALQIGKLMREGKAKHMLQSFQRSEYSEKYKNKVISAAKRLSQWGRVKEAYDAIDYKDAGNRDYKKNQELIQESVEEFEILSWKMKNGFDL